MAGAEKSSASITHPEPHRSKVEAWLPWAGLFGAPLAWVGQMSLSQILSSYACYPHQSPLAVPLWGHLILMLAIISILFFIGGLGSVMASWTAWQKNRHALAEKNHPVTQAGEGRIKFLALLGILSSLLFTIAIIFTGTTLLLVSPCGI